MKYLSLFSGIGGFELGIQQAYETRISNEMEQWGCGQKENKLETFMPNTFSESNIRQSPDCIGFSEIDKYAIQIYQKHFNHKNYGDITKINEKELPEFDLIVGGFPCQSFSIAGKRGGFNDTRGTMFFHIARILKAKQPRLLLLENVKGLLSHDEGRTFATIISTLDELGYDLQWQVLNSKNFGVPQNRERVFIIGHLRGTPRPKVFPIGETTTGSIKVCARGKHQQDIVYDKSGILNLPAGTHGSTPHLTKIMDGGQAYSWALRGRDYKDGTNFISKGTKIRRLTPTECERLQGFPDGWTEGVSDTQRYKCLGNAVTVNVIKEILANL